MKDWTPAELKLLDEVYPKMGTACAKMLGRSKKAVETKASKRGLRRVYAARPKRIRHRPTVGEPPNPYGRLPGGPVTSIFDLASRM